MVVSAQAQITVPIYACHGTSDRCTSLPAVKRLIENASSTDKVLKEIKGGYHEASMDWL
jgi:acylglycerol lipase